MLRFGTNRQVSGPRCCGLGPIGRSTTPRSTHMKFIVILAVIVVLVLVLLPMLRRRR